MAGVRAPAAVGAVLAAASVAVLAHDPHAGGYGLCPVRALTGFACPTCGGLRAAHDLLTGNLHGAWSMNPYLSVALPLLGIAWAMWMARAWRGRHSGRPLIGPPTWLIVAAGVSAVVFGVLRNVPALTPYLGPAA